MTLEDIPSAATTAVPLSRDTGVAVCKADRTRLLEQAWQLQSLDDRTGLQSALGDLCAWLDLSEILVAAASMTALSDAAVGGAGCDEQWRALYLRERFIFVDPIVRAIAAGRPFVSRAQIISEQGAPAAAASLAGRSRSYDRFTQLVHDYRRERDGFAGGLVYNHSIVLFSAVSARRHCKPSALPILHALRPVLCQAALRLLLPGQGWGVLSAREQTVLEYLAAGLGDIQIADALCVAVPTVRFHLRNVFRKLRARNRCHAVAIGFQIGLLDRCSGFRLQAT